jgi:hypothetical protein
MRERHDTPTPPFLFRAALARVTWNMGVGTAVFGCILLLNPEIPAVRAVPTLVAAFVAMGFGKRLTVPGFSPPAPEVFHGRVFRRQLSVILIGSSLAALLWSAQEIPWITLPIVLGFVARWVLYGLEVSDIRLCDRRKIGLPPLAARIRLWITLVTGALIPGLVLLEVSAPPLLLFSFFLTCFGQWSAICEIALDSTGQASS